MRFLNLHPDGKRVEAPSPVLRDSNLAPQSKPILSVLTHQNSRYNASFIHGREAPNAPAAGLIRRLNPGCNVRRKEVRPIVRL